MLKWTLLFLVVAACGFPRPADVISCTPGEFAACRGDTELTCNSTGADYDAVQCARGCDPQYGCRLCEASETICANGTVQSCDASGIVTSSQVCLLGCFEDRPRCREINPSNGLAPYMDMASKGPDLMLRNATIDVPLGRATSPEGIIDLKGTLVMASSDGVTIEVFPVRSLSLIGKTTFRYSGQPENPGIAFMVYGDARIDGSIILSASKDGGPPPGSIISGPCVGSPGSFDIAGVGYTSGGGGGGGATQGGAGGTHPHWPGSRGGTAFPHPDLQPLRGGCSGGSPADQPQAYGGGAIQITSRSTIVLGPNSTIEANGGFGFIGDIPPGQFPGYEIVPKGGGSGGAILLEAVRVNFDAGVVLAANGGAGASGDGVPGSSPSSRIFSFGGVCAPSSQNCTNGGDGGSVSTPGRSAESISFDAQILSTGAGGGSVGYIRINTQNGVYTKANDVFESPSPSTGIITTR